MRRWAGWIQPVWRYPSAQLQGWWRVERWVRELVFALTRARVLARVSAQAQALVLDPASVQALVQPSARVSVQASVQASAQASVQVLAPVSSPALSQALAQASVQVLAQAQAQMSVQSFPPPCRLLWRRSSDPVLRLVALQGRGAWIAVVAPRSPCK